MNNNKNKNTTEVSIGDMYHYMDNYLNRVYILPDKTEGILVDIKMVGAGGSGFQEPYFDLTFQVDGNTVVLRNQDWDNTFTALTR